MKKIISFLCIISMLFAFAGCIKTTTDHTNTKIVKNIMDLYDTENYEEKVEKFSLIPSFDEFYTIC